MRGIIQLLLFLILLFFLLKLLFFVIKRCLLLFNLYSLVGMCNAKITLHSFPFRPMWMMPKGPDVSVEILDTVYLLRLYSGRDGFSSVHFVNERYSAVYMQVRGATRVARARINTPTLTGGINIGTKVNILPDFEVPKEYLDGREIVKVLLLNPSPSALTYVTEEKTSIRIAFTGDELYGMKVFTASTFVNHADRESRKPRDKSTEYAEFDYFTDGMN